jgi:streptogramin lyase
MVIPYDYEEIATSTSAAVKLTAAKVDAMANRKGFARIFVVGYPVAFLLHGTAPTSGTLQQWPVSDGSAGQVVPLDVEGRVACENFQAIAIGGAGHLAVTYFRRQ